MKIVNLVLLILNFALISSCKKAEAEAVQVLPISTFDAPFPKNNKQLSRIFGTSLLIKNNGDTLFLKIASTKNENLITNSRTGDTIFFGKVCKFREFYYLNHKVNDTSYYISAFKIKDNLIYGLFPWNQYYDVDSNIIKGNGKKLVKTINADTTAIRLKSDKREIKKLFRLIMNDVVPDTILISKSDIKKINQKESMFEQEIDETDNDIKVYPNPTTDFINVQVADKSNYQLSDFNGKIVLTGNLDQLDNRIDVGNQKAGFYFLSVTDLQNGEKQTVKIVIK